MIFLKNSKQKEEKPEKRVKMREMNKTLMFNKKVGQQKRS